MRAAIFFAFFLVLCTFANAQISDYNAPNPYYWDTLFSVDGNYTVAGDPTTTLCHFFIYDENNQIMLYRLTSEYVTTSGRFSSNPIILKSPPFERGHSYHVTTYCGTSSADKNFIIGNRKNFGESLAFDWDWLWQSDNLIALLAILIIAGLAFVFYNATRDK